MTAINSQEDFDLMVEDICIDDNMAFANQDSYDHFMQAMASLKAAYAEALEPELIRAARTLALACQLADMNGELPDNIEGYLYINVLKLSYTGSTPTQKEV